jgi:hypothetical protein
MIHVVFQQNDIDVLKQAIALDKTLEGPVIQIADDFAVGPLRNIYSGEGIALRKQWWRDVLAGGDYHGIVDNGSVPDDDAAVSALISALDNDPEETLWIWAAQNKHDVSGYYWLMNQLSSFQGRIFILYLNNLPFINPKGHLFYPVNLFDIPAKEFLKAKKLARPITAAEFEVDPDEWQRLCNEEKGVRILEGGKKLQQFDYDFFDEELRGFITADWQKASKIIHHFSSKAKQITGDAYLLWRLKQMVASGEADVQGELKKMKDFEIKKKSLQAAGENV